MDRQLRTREEIDQRIRDSQAAWKELDAGAQSKGKVAFLAGLAELYWILGYSHKESIDNAFVALGEDLIDWGDQ